MHATSLSLRSSPARTVAPAVAYACARRACATVAFTVVTAAICDLTSAPAVALAAVNAARHLENGWGSYSEALWHEACISRPQPPCQRGRPAAPGGQARSVLSHWALLPPPVCTRGYVTASQARPDRRAVWAFHRMRFAHRAALATGCVVRTAVNARIIMAGTTAGWYATAQATVAVQTKVRACVSPDGGVTGAPSRRRAPTHAPTVAPARSLPMRRSLRKRQ